MAFLLLRGSMPRADVHQKPRQTTNGSQNRPPEAALLTQRQLRHSGWGESPPCVTRGRAETLWGRPSHPPANTALGLRQQLPPTNNTLISGLKRRCFGYVSRRAVEKNNAVSLLAKVGCGKAKSYFCSGAMLNHQALYLPVNIPVGCCFYIFNLR